MRECIAVFARRAGNYVPDAAASSVIMLFALVGTSLALGDSLSTNLDACYRGLWMLLPFSMQMTLIVQTLRIRNPAPRCNRPAHRASRPRGRLQTIDLPAPGTGALHSATGPCPTG